MVKNVGKDLVPFEVSWVDRFPVIEDIAYVFPLSVWHAIRMMQKNPDLRYFPESYDGPETKRIKEIIIERPFGAPPFEETAMFTEFAQKRRWQWEPDRGDIAVIFPYPLQQSYVDAFAAQFDFEYFPQTVSGDPLQHVLQSEGRRRMRGLLLPPGRLSERHAGIYAAGGLRRRNGLA